MAGYSKLFSTIVTSSIWGESHATIRVWITMLAQCDYDGIVGGCIPGLAYIARVTDEEMKIAITVLMAPDPHSRTKANEGRRIREVDGGWQILNYPDYRNRGQSQEGSRAPYMKARRAAKSEANV